MVVVVVVVVVVAAVVMVVVGTRLGTLSTSPGFVSY